MTDTPDDRDWEWQHVADVAQRMVLGWDFLWPDDRYEYAETLVKLMTRSQRAYVLAAIWEAGDDKWKAAARDALKRLNKGHGKEQ